MAISLKIQKNLRAKNIMLLWAGENLNLHHMARKTNHPARTARKNVKTVHLLFQQQLKDRKCVYANGEDLVPPVHVKIPAYKMELLEDVITVVSEKMHLRVGVNGLYTVDGHPIKDPKELKNGGHYVAVCSGKFKPAQYGRDAPASCKSSKKECKALSPVAGTVHHEQTVHADAETVKTTDGAELKNMDVQEEPKPKTMELTIPFLSDVRLNVSKEENLSLQTPQRPIKLCQCLVEFLGNPEFKPITGEKTIDEDFVIDLIVVLLCSKDPMERKITKWVLKKIFEI
ncbi:doublecortin domain-containing protein 2C-like isoform X3 [Thalassophryne amazonica]|uniref:doublecortin domain-containing protein 2C-like isoform X3 n=1 Tax=Thalassophryne amazonica TaxID=390379 RepID=UPI00147261D1|nr:doublecortin domain-containing protein 2C-like isoform X3 [Thalassophryne amazonica]XP_034043858.1 doublecortin domain-containing protein 2C-like isoform X3 [Thalassophryne amazonica]XP_034043859.1 doublecortin domain-containing protein 2C-like isoform X3 [Thalassophryne amazonica]